MHRWTVEGKGVPDAMARHVSDISGDTKWRQHVRLWEQSPTVHSHRIYLYIIYIRSLQHDTDKNMKAQCRFVADRRNGHERERYFPWQCVSTWLASCYHRLFQSAHAPAQKCTRTWHLHCTVNVFGPWTSRQAPYTSLRLSDMLERPTPTPIARANACAPQQPASVSRQC